MDAPSLAESKAETPAVADEADPAIDAGPPPGDRLATHRRDAGGPVAPPSVVAVVVVGRGGASLDDCLGSLSRQDYPNITLLILDNSPVEEPPFGDVAAVAEAVSDAVGGLPGVVAPELEMKPETGLMLSARVAAAAPGSYVKRLERSSSYAAAANEVLATVQGADYLYFCHDDVASAPDAVRLLVEEAQRSGAAMVGPKIVRWDDHDRLLAVGMGVDKTAFMVPIVEPGELDQAQHDGSREVVAVPGTAFLIRTPVFASVGGFDERLHEGAGVDGLDVGEDVDLGWRVRLMGERVVTAPIARVAHAQREPSIRSNRRATVLRNRLRITLKNTDVLRLPGAFAALFVQSIGSMMVGFFRSGRPEISMHASAWWWNIRHGPDIVGRRRTVHRGNRRFERPVRHSLLPASARLRAVLRDEAADDTAKVWSGLAGGVRSLTKRGPQRWVLGSVFVTAAVTVMGSRRLFADLPLFRQFQPLPATGALWRHLQARGAVSPAFAVLTVVRFFLRSWAASAIVLAMLPLGLIGAWRLAMVVYGDLAGDTTSAEKTGSEIRPDEQMTHWAAASVRIMTVLGYGLVPLPYNAIAAGRWEGLVAYGFAPWVLRSLWRSASLGPSFDSAARDRNRRWLAILRVGLPTALAAAFAPTLLLLVLVVTAAMAAGQLLVGGRWRELGRMVEAGIGGVGLAVALLLPWSFGFFAHPRQSGFVPGLGRLPQGPDGARRFLELLAFRNGPTQLGWLGIGLFGAAALSLFSAKGAEWQWIVRLWTVAIAGFGVAWAAQRGWLGPGQRVLGPSVVLAPAALSLALAAAIGLAGFLLRARQASFGWRQLLAPVTVIVFTFGLLPSIWAARSGYWNLPRTAWNDSLGWLDRPTVWIGDADALVLPGHLLTGTTRAGIAPAGVPDVRLLWPPGGALAEGFVAAQIQEAVTQKTSRLGARLRSSGIGYIVVIERPAPGRGRRITVPEAIRAGLDAQLDLQQVDRTSDVTVYRNSALGGDVGTGAEFPSTRTRILLGASATAWLWAISRWRRTARATAVGSTTASEAPEPASLAPAVDSYLTSSTDAFSEESDELFSTPAAGSLANEMYENLRRRRGVRAPRSKERS